MSDGTKIEWTEATWNPITGCSVTSPGCTNCYAMKLAGTRLRNHESRTGLTMDTKAGPVWTGEVRFNDQWLDQPLRWKRSRMIFVCAHGDLFHENVPEEWIDRVFAVMALCPQHTFQVLTKRADRMRKYCESRFETEIGADKLSEAIENQTGAHNGGEWDAPLPNVWVGVSVEDQARANERIPDLLATPAALRWLSCEPLLGPVDLRWISFPSPLGGTELWDCLDLHGDPGPSDQKVPGAVEVVDWVVVGGESGPGARAMHPDWARSLRDQCAAAGVPFFFKQWGDHLPGEIFHPESKRGAGAVHWLDGTDEYNGEHIDFTTAIIGKHVPDGCPVHANERQQIADKGWIDANAAGNFARDCARPACQQAARYCRGDDKPWLTVARRVGKKNAGRSLDGVQHDGMPEVPA